jgi:hypothetical protein
MPSRERSNELISASNHEQLTPRALRLRDTMQLPPFSSEPVFIGGDNRSGTTLVAIILDSHPELVVGPELDFRDPDNLGPELLRGIELLESGDPRVIGPGVQAAPELAMPVQLVKQCHRFGVEFRELAQLVRSAMSICSSQLVELDDRVVLIDAVGEHRRARAGASRFGFKIQRDLLAHAEYARLWPRARFVHVVRDGRDVAASHLRSERHLYYSSIHHAAHGWAELMEGTRALVEQGRVIEIRYEELVREPEPTLRRLLAGLELGWHQGVLAHTQVHHDLLEHPYEHPSAAAVSRPIHGAAIGRYRRDLSAHELATFEAVAGDWLERMGYR